MNRDLTIADKKQRILNTFKYYTHGPSVPSDGNCGLHAICKALGDALSMTGSNTNPNSLMRNIFHMFDLKNLPYYWWSDEELAVIADNFGYDMYIYNETDRTGIVYGKGIRSPLVLYSVNDNSHWIPGMKTLVPSSRIPKNFTIIENISEVLSIKQIKLKIKGHLLMRSLNPSGGCIEAYSVRQDGSRSSSNGRRVASSSRRHNRSRSVGLDEGRNGNHGGMNNVMRNTRRDESRSGGRNGRCSSEGRDGVRIVRQDRGLPQLEKHHGKGVKESHSGEKKGNHTGGEKGSNSGREKESHSLKEKSYNQKSDEQLLIQYSMPVNDDHSYGLNAAKKEFSLFAKLKNTVLSKMIRHLYHWNRNKKIKYKKLDLFESEDEVDDSEDTEFNAMYNAQYTIFRDMLHNFVPKNECTLLTLKACDALLAPQSFEPNNFQLEPINCQQLEPVEVECSMVGDNCCQMAAVQYCPIETVNRFSIEAIDCCSTEAIDCCSNVVVNRCPNLGVDCCTNGTVSCLYKTSKCPCMPFGWTFISTNCPCNIDDCPFKATEYPFSGQWVSDKYINDLFYSYTLGRKKIKGVRLFDRVYNQAIAMSNNVIVRSIIKSKRAVGAPSKRASVLVAPAFVTSMVTASVFASPAMAAWVVAAPGLAPLVLQVAQKVTAPAMVALMMVAPEMVEMTVPVAPLGNDLLMAPVDNDLLATSVDNDSVVKRKNICVKRNFSLKQIWKKKTKTQHSKDN